VTRRSATASRPTAPSRQPAPARPARAAQESAYRSQDFLSASDLGLTLPALVLAIRVEPKLAGQPVYRFRPQPARTWLKLAVPMGGKTARYLATVIQPTTAAAYEIATLARRWPTVTARPQGGPSLAAVNDYSEYLRDHLRCSCETCYGALATGHYPIDVDCLRLLTDEWLPQPDELVEWRSGYQRAAGAASRWSLVIIS
jgi:hypothetical protein